MQPLAGEIDLLRRIPLGSIPNDAAAAQPDSPPTPHRPPIEIGGVDLAVLGPPPARRFAR